jgi:hypothetical protein
MEGKEAGPAGVGYGRRPTTEKVMPAGGPEAARRRGAGYGVSVMGKLKPIKATRKHKFRVDEYDPSDDPERQRRIAAHRRRVQRALKRLGL